MSENLRYEVKMVVQAMSYSRIRMHLRTDESAIRTLHPPRRVQSIYLDTWRNAALEENLAGISHREKVRFRWYGETRAAVTGTLERKVRENMLGWKELLPIPTPLGVEGVTRTAFSDSLQPHLTDAWDDVRGRRLLPAQWVSYEREYYATGAGRGPIRITIDRKLQTWDQRYRRSLSSRFRSPVPDVMIIEAKCAKADYEALKAVMERFPVPVDRCSKFVYASSPTEGASASFLPL